MIKRVEVFYSGRVQGVGFRYTVDRLARHFPVTGYVRNLANGQVHMLAEGDQTSLGDFLSAIRESPMKPHISNEVINWTEASGAYQEFGIAY